MHGLPDGGLYCARLPDCAPTGTRISSSRRLRIALYSPGMVGLGHMRRSLLIAHALSRSPLDPVLLLLAEAREANALHFPSGADGLTLPALREDGRGTCSPRYLAVSPKEIVALRSRMIRAALDAFRPDVFLVDHKPRGAAGELRSALNLLRSRGRTRCVLGVRDILDDPEVVRAEWRTPANEEAIREHYDAVWIYGDPAVYDGVREYGFPDDIAAKTEYTGYLDQCERLAISEEGDSESALLDGLPPGRLALCLVGGGQDGGPLAEAFARAKLPSDMNGVILTGPYMPAEARRRVRGLAAANARIRLLELISEPTRIVRHANRVIAMGGYNTTCEVLSFEKESLLVPRVEPRREQIIRAQKLRDMGLLDMLHPDLLTSDALSMWLARDAVPRPRVRELIRLDGLARLPELLERLLSDRLCAAA